MTQRHPNEPARAKGFYRWYIEKHWKTCQEDDCPTCWGFEQFHITTRKELRKLKEEIDNAKGGESI